MLRETVLKSSSRAGGHGVSPNPNYSKIIASLTMLAVVEEEIDALPGDVGLAVPEVPPTTEAPPSLVDNLMELIQMRQGGHCRA
jgi:hypothetical protein